MVSGFLKIICILERRAGIKFTDNAWQREPASVTEDRTKAQNDLGKFKKCSDKKKRKYSEDKVLR